MVGSAGALGCFLLWVRRSYSRDYGKIKDNLEATNEFKPNSSFLRQVENTSLFGSIRLFGFTNFDLFKSQIQIEDNQQSIDSLCNAILCDPNGGPSFGEDLDIQRGNINN